MTFSTFFLYLLGSRLTMGTRDILQESYSQMPIDNLRGLLKTIFLATISIEMVGALFLTLRFLSDMPLQKSIYFGIFHSISAFCNAGFALFSDSFISYNSDLVVNLTLLLLIIMGGLGFLVIFELSHQRSFQWEKISLHSRLVLTITALLILGGTVLFFVLEYANTIKDLPWGSKILVSLFQSITTRTAGFNTIDIRLLSNPTLFVFIVLMIIGASPGSCPKQSTKASPASCTAASSAPYSMRLWVVS